MKCFHGHYGTRLVPYHSGQVAGVLVSISQLGQQNTGKGSLGVLLAALLIHPLDSSDSRDVVAPLIDVPVLCYGDKGNRAPERSEGQEKLDRNDTLIPMGTFFLMDDDKVVAVARDDVWIWERKILELERMGYSEQSTGSDSEVLTERTSCSFGTHADLASGAAGPVPAAMSTMEEIQVELQCADLWKRFHDIGTEMIITKAGRRMFPAMRVKITGLDPHQQYYIAMDIVPVDNKRYRYVYHSSKWMVAGNADSPVPPRVYIHPDSLASGDTWMRQVVSFDKLKLTNNELDDQGHIILHSMHKYQPRVHVIRKDFSSDLSPTKPVPVGDGVKTFNFPETVFTTVTAYQNQQTQVLSPSAPSSYVIIMSSYVRISSTSWLCRTESCSPLYLKTPVYISLPCDLKAIRPKNNANLADL
ncbi:hypothetical protein U0070_012043 [Myodes glareolus]|uniref:T-box domain-containing protein n=1 Tax=Myodes glareolus TaxID=447135 RepID=A0AAW0I0E3_MYOGA